MDGGDGCRCQPPEPAGTVAGPRARCEDGPGAGKMDGGRAGTTGRGCSAAVERCLDPTVPAADNRRRPTPSDGARPARPGR